MKSFSLKKIADLSCSHSDSEGIFKGVAVNSQHIKRGNLFFALPGEKTDGHQFLESAALKGAVAAVVSKGYKGPDFGLSLIYVDNVLDALQLSAKKILNESPARVVAITGSLGKTTTKEFVTTLLQQKYKVTKSPGNSNSQIGLPLTLFNELSFDEEIIVLEMGMTHPKQILKLIDIAPPEVAVLTSVSLVHAANFNSLRDIAKAKVEIFYHPKTKLGIYHEDSCINEVLQNDIQCNKKSFSIKSTHANFYLNKDTQGLLISGIEEKPVLFPFLSVKGAHNQHNFLAAVAVAHYFGLTQQDILKGQKELKLPENRLQFIEKKGVLFINDAYNASEDSVKAALDAMPEPIKGGRKIFVFGGIVELGKFSFDCHQSIGLYALKVCDAIYCFGEDCLPIIECFKEAKKTVVFVKNRDELIPVLKQDIKQNDVVLLKGSNAKGLYTLLDEL